MSAAARPSTPCIVSVMGAPGSHKVAYVNAFMKTQPARSDHGPVDFVSSPHPTLGNGENLLKMFTEDPIGYATLLQSIMMNGIVWQVKGNQVHRAPPVTITTTSIVDVIHVYTELMKSYDYVDGTDDAVIGINYNTLLCIAPWAWPRVIVYVESSPEECWDALLARNCPAEIGTTHDERRKLRVYHRRLWEQYKGMVEQMECSRIVRPDNYSTTVVRIRSGTTTADAVAVIADAVAIAMH